MISETMLNTALQPILHKATVGSSALQLSPIQVNREYAEKWNERMTDFVVLTRNGELVNNSLYRVGGLNTPKPESDRYFMLIKYVEAYYDKAWLKQIKSNSKPEHLEGRWCIIDSNGIEKVEFEQFKHPYLVKDSCIYSLDRKYYNIETGYFYCDASTSMQSNDFLFLENAYDKDKSRRGVMKIDKKSGTWELFP